MRIGNCAIHALVRWIKRGGWLILRRSPFGPYPHMMHTDHLPENLPVSQFVSDDESIPWWHIFFKGHLMHQVGSIKAPPVKGRFDWVLLVFVLSVLASLAGTLTFAVRYAISFII